MNGHDVCVCVSKCKSLCNCVSVSKLVSRSSRSGHKGRTFIALLTFILSACTVFACGFVCALLNTFVSSIFGPWLFSHSPIHTHIYTPKAKASLGVQRVSTCV